MGNEVSGSVTYGQRLLNDIQVEWKKLEGGKEIKPRDGHCAASIGEKLFVFGGVCWGENGEVSESREIFVFDSVSQSWSKLVTSGQVPEARSSAAMTAVGNSLYVFGGLSRDFGWFNDLHTLDTETMVWREIKTAVGNPPCPRDKLSAVTMGSKVLFFGGFGPLDESDNDDDESKEGEAEFGWFNDLHSFDTESNTWEKLSPALLNNPTPRAACGMCIIGQNLIIFGGRDSVQRKNDLYILDTETMQWVQRATVGRQPEPRSFHTCTAVGRRMVVTGGRSLNNTHFNDVHVFDLDKHEWMQPAMQGKIPPARGVHTATVVGDQLLLYGGSSDFDEETMQCQQYYNDCFIIPTVQILTGESQGLDPNDSPSSQVADTASQIMPHVGDLETIEEDCDTEDDESSDEQ